MSVASVYWSLQWRRDPVPLHSRQPTRQLFRDQSSFMGTTLPPLPSQEKNAKKVKLSWPLHFPPSPNCHCLNLPGTFIQAGKPRIFSRCRGFFMGILTSYLLYTLASWCSCCSSSPWKNGGNMVEIIGFVRPIAILHISSCTFTGICGWNQHKSS